MGLPLLGNSATVLQLSQAFYGVAPSYATYTTNLAYLTANGNTLFGTVLAQQNQFATMTDAQFSAMLITNLGLTAFGTGQTPDLQTALTAYITANEVGAANANAVRGTIALQLASLLTTLEGATGVQAVYAPAAVAFNAQQSNAYVYSTNTASTAPAAVGTTIGQTFVLTTGVDTGTAFVGAAGDDTFNALTALTFNALDSLDGGAGTGDLLIVADNANAVATAGRTVTNIEIAKLSSSATVAADTTGWTGLKTLEAVGTGGVNVTAASTTTTITASNTGANAMAIIGGGGVLTLSNGAAAVTVGQTAVANAFTEVKVTGGSTVQIADKATATTTGSALKTVTVVGTTTSDDITITANGLTTLNLTTLQGATTAGDTTITAAAGTRALAVNLNGVDTGADGVDTAGGFTITDATATSVAYSANTAASFDITAVHAAATSATINAAVGLQMDALTSVLVTTLGISGAGAVSMTADTLAANVVITSTNTGGVTLTQALTTGQQFVGTTSSGADSIGVGATTVAISTGDGNDTVTFSAAAVGTGGSIAGGGGTGDTLSMTATNAATASSTAPLGTAFAASVTGFEKLVLTTVTTNTVDVSRLGFTDISSAGDTLLTLNGVTTGTTLRLTGAGTAQTVASTTALLNGASDVLNVALTAVTTAGDIALSATGLTATDIETVAITSDYASSMTAANKTTAIAGSWANQITVLGNIQKTITVGGAAGLNLTATDTALTTMDASGMTVGATGEFSWTSGALAAAAVVKGSASAINTITFDAAGAGVTYTGGSGADVISGLNAFANTVTLGNGTNSFTHAATAGIQTVTGGTGVDTITGGTANDVIVGGGGADQITGGTGADKITVSGSTATLFYAAAGGDSGTNTSTTIQTAELTSTFDVVTGAATGLKLNLGTTAGTDVAGYGGAAGATLDVSLVTNLAGVADQIVFARGAYDSAAGTFTYAANGADSVVTYDASGAGNGSAYNSVVLVGFVQTVTTGAVVAGVLTLG